MPGDRLLLTPEGPMCLYPPKKAWAFTILLLVRACGTLR